MIPQDFVEKLKQQVDIIDIAGSYFSLKKAGSLYQAICPHGEDTGSLTFFPETQSFHCFACGAGSKQKTEGSDVVSFVMWMEKCTFPEAVTKLAAMKGLEIPSKMLSEEEKKRKKVLSHLLDENRRFWLSLKDNTEMLKYFEDRGITKADIDKWRIGMVPKEDKTRVAGRAAFAIMDDIGQTVGFSYRNMSDVFPEETDPDTGPKYMNSAKSSVFDKGSILYGLNFVKRMVREKDYVVLAEGFGDTILGQHYNCPFVSMMGTSLTQEHVKLLARYTKNIYVWLDGDAGGINATLRHLDALRKEGFLIKVIYTPRQDPDDVIMEVKDGLEEWILSHGILAGQFQINMVMEKFHSDLTELKLKTIQDVKQVLQGMESSAERMIYCNQIAHQLSVDAAMLMR